MDHAPAANEWKAPGTLEDWQSLLERAFFCGRDPAEPFIFDLEVSEEIRTLAGKQDLRPRLAACVSAKLDLTSSADIFAPLQSTWRRWQVGSRTSVPPNLAALAVTVAAATEMHRDKGAPSQAYFYRLAELLQPHASHEALSMLRERLSASFDTVARWWRDLHDWVEANPQVGLNTIRKHPHLTRIGYPMSQAIIRRSDRMRLTRFYDKLDLPTLGVPSQDALLSQLDLWAATPRELSSTLMGALSDSTRRTVLAAYLHRLAREWDGVVLDADGAIHLDIRLAIDLDDYSARWVIKAKPGTAAVDSKVNNHQVVLKAPEYGSFYDWIGPNPAVRAIPGKPAVVAAGVGISGRFVFPPLQPMRADPDVGWLSVDDVQPYLPHILLVAPDWHAQVEKVLEAAARKGWRRIGQKPGTQLVPGRAIYIKVEIEDASAFRAALTEIDPSLARALRSPGGFRPRLVNGLGIFTHLGQRHYLRGGEPDLLLPLGESPRSVPAALDDSAQEHPFHATGFPIPLRVVGPLNVGPHVLDVDGEHIRFDVHKPDAPQMTSDFVLGWIRKGSSNELHEVQSTASSSSAIRGAVVASEQPEPLLLRRKGRQYYVIDRRGFAEQISPPPTGPLFKLLGIPDSTLWEYTPPFDIVWLVDRRQNGQFTAQCLRFIEPNFSHIDSASRAIWEEMHGRLSGANRLLDMYLRAWERMSADAG